MSFKRSLSSDAAESLKSPISTTGGYNSVTPAHLTDNGIKSEANHPQKNIATGQLTQNPSPYRDETTRHVHESSPLLKGSSPRSSFSSEIHEEGEEAPPKTPVNPNSMKAATSQSLLKNSPKPTPKKLTFPKLPPLKKPTFPKLPTFKKPTFPILPTLKMPYCPKLPTLKMPAFLKPRTLKKPTSPKLPTLDDHPVFKILHERELGKSILVLAIPMIIGLYSVYKPDRHTPLLIRLAAIFLSVGVALIWNGILLRQIWDTCSRLIELLGIIFMFSAFFVFVSCFLPHWYLLVPGLCGGSALLPFVIPFVVERGSGWERGGGQVPDPVKV